MNQAKVARKAPYVIDVEPGRRYLWCACGLSANQPFCDGSHRETAIEPIAYEAGERGRIFFCGCKRSSQGATCDGTHMKLHRTEDAR